MASKSRLAKRTKTKSTGRKARTAPPASLYILPQEVRDMIYGFVLLARYNKADRRGPNEGAEEIYSSYNIQTALLETNREIYDEAKRVLDANQFIYVEIYMLHIMDRLEEYGTRFASHGNVTNRFGNFADGRGTEHRNFPMTLKVGDNFGTPGQALMTGMRMFNSFLITLEDLPTFFQALNVINFRDGHFFDHLTLVCDVRPNRAHFCNGHRLMAPMRTSHGWQEVTVRGDVNPESDVTSVNNVTPDYARETEMLAMQASTFVDVWATQMLQQQLALIAAQQGRWLVSRIQLRTMSEVFAGVEQYHPLIWNGKAVEWDAEIQNLRTWMALNRTFGYLRLNEWRYVLLTWDAVAVNNLTADQIEAVFYFRAMANVGLQNNTAALQDFTDGQHWLPDSGVFAVGRSIVYDNMQFSTELMRLWRKLWKNCPWEVGRAYTTQYDYT